MARFPYHVRPETAVLTRGFDPQSSVGSARPPVYRSSTYVFSSPEAAERAFGIVLGKIRPLNGEAPDLIYARLNHPNAQILGRPARAAGTRRVGRCGLQFRDGGDFYGADGIPRPGPFVTLYSTAL